MNKTWEMHAQYATAPRRLLNVRRPIFVRKAVLRSAQQIMAAPFIGNLVSLLHFFTTIAFVSFVSLQKKCEGRLCLNGQF